MKLTRPSRVAAAILALFSMLFMQLAIAAYACPGMMPMSGQMDMSAMSADQNMEHCKGMDLKAPSLCYAHDQAGNQSLDKPGTPQIQPFTAIGLALPMVSVPYTAAQSQSVVKSVVLARTTAPPISIRNCCFRV
jgi:hypothetical protein